MVGSVWKAGEAVKEIEVRYTTAEWTAIRLAGDDDAIIVRPDRWGGVTVGHYGNVERANLIAAAPEMLAALKLAERFSCQTEILSAAMYEHVISTMRAAIAKAEGNA